VAEPIPKPSATVRPGHSTSADQSGQRIDDGSLRQFLETFPNRSPEIEMAALRVSARCEWGMGMLTVSDVAPIAFSAVSGIWPGCTTRQDAADGGAALALAIAAGLSDATK